LPDLRQRSFVEANAILEEFTSMHLSFTMLPCLLLAVVASSRGLPAQAMKPFRIEGHQSPEIKAPEQPSFKIAKPEPYEVTPPIAPKSYAGEPILRSAPTSANRSSGTKKSAARRTSSRAASPTARRAVAPRSAPAPSSPRQPARGRGRLFRGIR
jgi:hypothetical protein